MFLVLSGLCARTQKIVLIQDSNVPLCSYIKCSSETIVNVTVILNK